MNCSKVNYAITVINHHFKAESNFSGYGVLYYNGKVKSDQCYWKS